MKYVVVLISWCLLSGAQTPAAVSNLSTPQDVNDIKSPRMIDYPPARVEELLKSGVAKKIGGAEMVNRELMRQQTYQMGDTSKNRVFIYALEGVFYGESLDEQFDNGRHVETTQTSIVWSDRNRQTLSNDAVLPFIRKNTKYIWEKNRWTGSVITWQFLTVRRNGEIVKFQSTQTDKKLWRDINITVPAELRPKPLEYYLRVVRPDGTEYEKALNEEATPNTSRALGWEKLIGGSCAFRLEVPESQSGLIFELQERLVPDRFDPTAGAPHMRKITSMMVKVLPATDEPLIFKPLERN